MTTAMVLEEEMICGSHFEKNCSEKRGNDEGKLGKGLNV